MTGIDAQDHGGALGHMSTGGPGSLTNVLGVGGMRLNNGSIAVGARDEDGDDGGPTQGEIKLMWGIEKRGGGDA